MYNNFAYREQLTAHHLRTSKKKFSMIELMVVISIIAILAAMLLPVLSGLTERARVTKAKAEMNSISTAIKMYKSTYGILPIPSDEFPEGDYDYGKIMTLLTNVSYKNETRYNDYKNARNIRFLDLPANYREKGYLSPWGDEYKIGIDADYDGMVSGKKTTTATNEWLGNHLVKDDNTADNLYGTVFLKAKYDVNDGLEPYVYSWRKRKRK